MNAAKCTLAKWEGAFINRLRSMIGIYGFHEHKLRPLQNMPIRPRITRSGTKISSLTKTLTGTLIELKRLFTYDFTLTTSTGTEELRFLKHGCLQSDNITADRYQSELQRDNTNNALERNHQP